MAQKRKTPSSPQEDVRIQEFLDMIASDFYLHTIAEGFETAGFDTDFLDQAVEKSIRLAQEQQAGEDAQFNLWEQKWW